MGKAKRGGASANTKDGGDDASVEYHPKRPPPYISYVLAWPLQGLRSYNIREWITSDTASHWWTGAFLFVNLLLGFWAGTTGGGFSSTPADNSSWRPRLAASVRQRESYQFLTFHGPFWDDVLERIGNWAHMVELDIEAEEYAKNPSHPRVFAVLREAVLRDGGYVHPDLGVLMPAPSGAARGLGMVRSSFHDCQISCLPGTAAEKAQYKKNRATARDAEEVYPFPEPDSYAQEEILVKVPLSFQMTRSAAFTTLQSVVPAKVQHAFPLTDLDDASFLALFLAHERGVGQYSKWAPYIASLPPNPSCGYATVMLPYLMDTIDALHYELGLDTHGWKEELVKASKYANQVADGLNARYGAYLSTHKKVSTLDNIKWALCQVASRATAGNSEFGALRMVPVLDLVNHAPHAGSFIELVGNEPLASSDSVDATEDDTGTFVLRSLWHGRRQPLSVGQELLANYNIDYTPLDWLILLGFVPSEHWHHWVKIEPAVPRVRRDGPFAHFHGRNDANYDATVHSASFGSEL